MKRLISTPESFIVASASSSSTRPGRLSASCIVQPVREGEAIIKKYTLAAMRIDLVGTTVDFRPFGHPQPLPINHLLCENRRTQGRMGEVGLGSAETRVPSHGWRRAPRKRHGVGRYRYRPDFQTATMAYPPSIAAVRHFTAAAHIAARRIDGDRLRPLRSAQAIAVHQDGIGGHGHPVERCRFLPGPSEI